MTIELLVRLNVDNPDVLVKILDVSTHEPAFDQTVKPKYGDLEAQLRMEVPFSRDVIVPVPLHRLEDFTTLVRLPVQGDINRYPEDWYRTSCFAEIVLPDGLYYDPDASEEGGALTLPLNLSLSAAPDTDSIIHYQVVERNDPVEGHRSTEAPDQEFSLLIRRDRLSRAFVWTMALTPLLLFLIAISHHRNPRTAPSLANPFSLELAAALLAILPLRQVLVPPEVRGLTTVDFLLGTELAAFIALVVWQNGISLWSESRVRKE
jgi:hypothetical protein